MERKHLYDYVDLEWLHLKEIPDNVIADLAIHPVKWIEDVLDIALENPIEKIKIAG